jgi:hypothetical protein
VAKSRTQRYVVVVFDGVSLGIMSFAFGVFDMAAYYGVLPDLEAHLRPAVNPSASTTRTPTPRAPPSPPRSPWD